MSFPTHAVAFTAAAGVSLAALRDGSHSATAFPVPQGLRRGKATLHFKAGNPAENISPQSRRAGQGNLQTRAFTMRRRRAAQLMPSTPRNDMCSLDVPTAGSYVPRWAPAWVRGAPSCVHPCWTSLSSSHTHTPSWMAANNWEWHKGNEPKINYKNK